MKKRKVAFSTQEFWKLLIDAGIEVPANVSRIIVDAKADGVVMIHWSCFADPDAAKVIADVIVDVQKGKNVQPTE